MIATKKITLEVLDMRIAPTVKLQTASSGVRIEIAIVNAGAPVDTDGMTARIRASKPDNTNVYNNCTVDGGRVIYDVTTQTISAAGKVMFQLELSRDGKVLYTPIFYGYVSNNIAAGAESSNEYNAFIAATEQIEKKEDASNKVSTISASSTDEEYPSARAVYNFAGSSSGGSSGGQDGFSPTVSVKQISGGHTVTITDKNGDKSFNVMDGAKGDKGDKGDTGAAGAKGDKGEPGEKGDTGAAGATGAKGDPFTYSDFTAEQLAALKGAQGEKGDKGDKGETGAKGDKGDAFVYSDFTAEQLAALKGAPGETGSPGAAGYTPVRGTDYWTSDDIAVIKSYVDDAILGGEW